MPSSYSFVCCGYTKDGTGQRYFAPMPHPQAMPYYPPDVYEPTSYRYRRRELIPAVPDGYQRDSDDLAPNRFQPHGRQPPMLPVGPRSDSPPIRFQEYPGSSPGPLVVIPPPAVRSPQPSIVVIQAPSPPRERSPIQPPAVTLAQIPHKLDQKRRRPPPSRSSDSDSYTPARPHREERIAARERTPSSNSDSVVPPPVIVQTPPPRSSPSRDSESDSHAPAPHFSRRADAIISRSLSPTESDSYRAPEPHTSPRTLAVGVAVKPQLNVSIDFGTEFSAIAYSSPSISGIREITSWPGSNESINKVPTCLVYDSLGVVQAWGIQAKHMKLEKEWERYEWFKLDPLLDPRPAPDGFRSSGKRRPFDLLVDYIGCLIRHVENHDKGVLDDSLDQIVHLTVPASWGIPQYNILQEAFGLASAQAEYLSGVPDLKIMTKVEAAAVYCAYMDALPVEKNHAFCICNAGAGAVDLAAYKFLGRAKHPELAEACIRSGSDYYGSLSLDLSFRDLLYKLQQEEGINLDPPNLQHYIDMFAQFKLTYQGELTGSDMVYFDCFDPSDHRGVGLVNGQIAISSQVLHRDVFEPVISKVVNSIERQLEKVAEPVDALFLVGGFSANEYLFTHVKEIFGTRIKSIERPRGADIAACRGAVLYGRNASYSSPVISSIISPKSYIVRVDLPAEPEDLAEHGTFISTNSQNIKMCANRALYIVRKGETASKRERIKVKIRAYAESISGDHFTATMYGSDSEEMSRYTIGDEMKEICQLRINLKPLSEGSVGSKTSRPYIDFAVGFTFDAGVSAVVYNDRDSLQGKVSVEMMGTRHI